MSACWINVVCRDHALAGVAGGFTQAGHGSDRTLERLARGDRIAFYSPRERLDGGAPVQAFTALGTVADDACFRVAVAPDFHPWRRTVAFEAVREAPVRPLLEALSFVPDPTRWGLPFRRGLFRVPEADFLSIARAMGAAAGAADATGTARAR